MIVPLVFLLTLLAAPPTSGDPAASRHLEAAAEAEELRAYGLPADAYAQAFADPAVRAAYATYAAAHGRADLQTFVRAWARTRGFTRAPFSSEQGAERTPDDLSASSPEALLLALDCTGTRSAAGRGPEPWHGRIVADVPAGLWGDLVNGTTGQLLWGSATEVVFATDREDPEHSISGRRTYDRRTRVYSDWASVRVTGGGDYGWSIQARCEPARG